MATQIVKCETEPATAIDVGTSCRTQIRDGANRNALHVARVLEMALAPIPPQAQ